MDELLAEETTDIKIARLEERATALEKHERVLALEKRLDENNLITRKEFDPIKRAVYASVSGILVTVLVALIVLSTS